MQTITVELQDDLDGSTDTTVATRRFSIGSVDYEIDLTDGNYESLKLTLERFTDNARTVKAKVAPSRSKAVRSQSADIRRWAREQGLTVSDSGRLPGPVKDKYEAAHAA